jgi:hypothetical protein
MNTSACAPRVDDHGPDHDHDLAAHAVLTALLAAHPAQRSSDELVRELTDHPDDFGERDRIENATRDLVGAGLAHRHGNFIFATRAAVRFDELWG